jgi:thiol-disulfide isomerase/thioredoxin
MVNFSAAFSRGFEYEAFLEKYGSSGQRQRWVDIYEQVQLSDSQIQLLKQFRRELKVLCLAGVWCGDCAEQCPIFARFAEHAPQIVLRFVDRDADAELARELSVCGGARVPAVLFLSEDDQPLGRYGDRTLSKYRDLVSRMDGVACSTGLAVEQGLLAAVTQDWLNEFERNQWILCTSPRLRAKHGE